MGNDTTNKQSAVVTVVLHSKKVNIYEEQDLNSNSGKKTLMHLPILKG